MAEEQSDFPIRVTRFLGASAIGIGTLAAVSGVANLVFDYANGIANGDTAQSFGIVARELAQILPMPMRPYCNNSNFQIAFAGGITTIVGSVCSLWAILKLRKM